MYLPNHFSHQNSLIIHIWKIWYSSSFYYKVESRFPLKISCKDCSIRSIPLSFHELSMIWWFSYWWTFLLLFWDIIWSETIISSMSCHSITCEILVNKIATWLLHEMSYQAHLSLYLLISKSYWNALISSFEYLSMNISLIIVIAQNLQNLNPILSLNPILLSSSNLSNRNKSIISI